VKISYLLLARVSYGLLGVESRPEHDVLCNRIPQAWNQLILAVPFTAVYKALFHEAPFGNVRSLAQENFDVWDEWEVPITVLGYLSSAFNSIVCIPLDIQPESDSQVQGKANALLERISFMCAFVS
jgi:hypothetical protein